MRTINANDIKKHGLSKSCIEEETLVTIRGEPKYVVLTLQKYQSLSEAELRFAVAEARRDYKAGRYVIETAKEHVKRITKSKTQSS